MSRLLAISIAAVCALTSLACFLVPLWVMSPFRRQGDRELSLAFTLLRTGPNISLICAIIAIAVTLPGWSAWVIVAILPAALMRINICEMVFRPYPSPAFDNANSVTLGPDDIVLSVSIGGETHAYSVGAIGYHHVVNDVIGGVPVAPSYCTLCHTGIVWNRVVDGRALNLHLIGIRDGNALLTDAETGSIWQQTSGEAISGPLKGKQLQMMTSDQLTFSLWRTEYPNGLMLRPKPRLKKFYADKGWDGFVAKFPILIDTTDTGIQAREVMLGIATGSASKAFPLKVVLAAGFIQDRVGPDSILLIASPDRMSVRVFRLPLNATFAITDGLLKDAETSSAWNFAGCAISGPRSGQCLQPIDAVKNYWFNWHYYHPSTEVYRT